MNMITLEADVGEDGVLHMDVALGKAAANKRVQVTIGEPASPEYTKEEWAKIVDEISGFWKGDFERPPMGEFEERDPL